MWYLTFDFFVKLIFSFVFFDLTSMHWIICRPLTALSQASYIWWARVRVCKSGVTEVREFSAVPARPHLCGDLFLFTLCVRYQMCVYFCICACHLSLWMQRVAMGTMTSMSPHDYFLHSREKNPLCSDRSAVPSVALSGLSAASEWAAFVLRIPHTPAWRVFCNKYI